MMIDPNAANIDQPTASASSASIHCSASEASADDPQAGSRSDQASVTETISASMNERSSTDRASQDAVLNASTPLLGLELPSVENNAQKPVLVEASKEPAPLSPLLGTKTPAGVASKTLKDPRIERDELRLLMPRAMALLRRAR